MVKLKRFGITLFVVTASPLLLACNRAHDVTVYPIVTIGEQHPYAATVAVYRVDAGKQDVIFWRPGTVEAPERLGNCAVRDPANWRCETNVGGDLDGVSLVSRQLKQYFIT